MALSDIATAVLITTVQSTLNLRTTNKAAFRSAVATFIKNKFPDATITASDLTSGKVVVLIDPPSGYVGFGRSIDDALQAIKAKTG